jgi:hypothetical protein
MPAWLIQVLRWGGLALAIVFAIALVVTQVLAPTPETGTAPTTPPPEASAAPVTLYWVLLVVGVIAAVVGFAFGRRKT